MARLDGVVQSTVFNFSGQAVLLVQLEFGKLRSGRTWQEAGLDALCLPVNMQREALGLQISWRLALI